MSITYSECVFVALVIQHEVRMSHFILCGLSASTVFFHIISITVRFSKKKVIEHAICALIFSTNFVSNFPHSKKN